MGAPWSCFGRFLEYLGCNGKLGVIYDFSHLQIIGRAASSTNTAYLAGMSNLLERHLLRIKLPLFHMSLLNC